MAVLLSGDFHANAMNELARITRRALVRGYGQALFNEIGYHVILGDAGFLWPGNEKGDASSYKTLAARPFPLLCVMGNHEPVLGRQDLPEVAIGIGEKVLLVHENPFIAYLKRGCVYTIDGFTFLALGGALSVDKEFRKEGISWWAQEYWSEAEKEGVMKRLKGNSRFDYVLSHTGPGRINRLLFQDSAGRDFPKFFDEAAALNERIDRMIACKGWFCGHWHQDKYYYDVNLKREYRYLYHATAVLRGDAVVSCHT
ncbi:MAG: metallophosphoesterase [Treponema sp.]|nr:metallophosphoesterase [Treponema sp.]